jgi:serine/threonine-protein phosphatase CPPED1
MIRWMPAIAFAALTLQAAEPLVFIQMSDPQFGMQTDNRDFAQETANFEFAIATANRLKPAFVVITGDLINKAADAAQSAEYLRIAAKLDPAIKLYNVPGNHDVGNAPTADSIAAYRKRFGPDYYSFRHGDFAGIVLDSSLISMPEKDPDEFGKQDAWLRKELAALKAGGARRVVIFQHHPYFLKTPDEPDQYFNIPSVRRKPYLDLFREYGVAAVFAGHLHQNAHGVDGPLEMVTTGPVGKPLGDARSGMRIVVVKDDGIHHDYADLGRLPDRVELR